MILPWPARKRGETRTHGETEILFELGQVAFGVQRRHTPGARRSDRLTVIIVGDVPSRENPRDRRVRPKSFGPAEISRFILFDLVPQK